MVASAVRTGSDTHFVFSQEIGVDGHRAKGLRTSTYARHSFPTSAILINPGELGATLHNKHAIG